MAKKEDSEPPKDLIEVYKLLESIRSRAGVEQFNFLHISATNILLVIRSALVLNTGSMIALLTFVGAFTSELVTYEDRWDNLVTKIYVDIDKTIIMIVIPSFLFFLGIISAVCSSYLRHLNYRYCVDMINYMWEEETDSIKARHPNISYTSYLLPETPKTSEEFKFPIFFLEYIQFHRFFKFHKIRKIMKENENASRSTLLYALIVGTSEESLKSVYLSYAFFATGYIAVAIIFTITIIV